MINDDTSCDTNYFTSFDPQRVTPNDFVDPPNLHHYCIVDVCVFGWNILTMIGWINMGSGSDIHVPLRMTCNNFGDHLTFSLAPS